MGKKRDWDQRDQTTEQAIWSITVSLAHHQSIAKESGSLFCSFAAAISPGKSDTNVINDDDDDLMK